MRLESVTAHKERLDKIRERLERLDKQVQNETLSGLDDAELVSDMACYLCIQVSGFIEQSIKSIYEDYRSTTDSSRFSRLVKPELANFSNANMSKIWVLADKLHPEWYDALKNQTDGRIKEQVDSLVANRNQIAHGGSVGLTYRAVNEYYKSALALVAIIEAQCSPTLEENANLPVSPLPVPSE